LGGEPPIGSPNGGSLRGRSFDQNPLGGLPSKSTCWILWMVNTQSKDIYATMVSTDSDSI